MTPQATDNTEYLQIGLNSYERGPDAMSRPHRHNEIELVYLKSGSVVYLFGGTKVALKPRTLVAFWAGVPHQVMRFSSSTVLLGLELPVAWFLQWKLPDFLTQSLLGGQLLTESDPAFQASDARALNRWNLDLHSGREELRRAVLLEVEARFWRFAGDTMDIASNRLGRSGCGSHAGKYSPFAPIDRFGSCTGVARRIKTWPRLSREALECFGACYGV